MQQITHEVIVDTAKVAPPASVAMANFWGVTVPEVIQVFTLIYVVGLVVQQGWRLYKFIRERKA